MRKTHLERFMGSPVGSAFLKGFSVMNPYDITKDIVPETAFETLFTPKFFADAMGGTIGFHSDRPQRKMETSVVQHMYHLWRDKNYFDISLRLCDKLMDTDLKDIDTFFLRTPFRSMYISLPYNNGMYIHNEQTGEHELKGIYVLFQDFGGPETIALRTLDNKVDGVLKYLHILAVGEEKAAYDDALVFFHLLFWEGKISDSIERSKKFLPSTPELWPSIQEIFSFVTKVLLYLNCSNVAIQRVAGIDIEGKLAGLKNKAKKRKFLQRYEKTSTEAHRLLDIVVNHTQASSNQMDSKASGELLGPKSLERVRGHFKVQHFGIGCLEQKVIWVEPYIRGSDAEYFRDEKHYRLI